MANPLVAQSTVDKNNLNEGMLFVNIIGEQSQFQNAPFWPISALGANCNPRNTLGMPEVEIIARLELDQIVEDPDVVYRGNVLKSALKDNSYRSVTSLKISAKT